ncbi:MAG TPA: 50S ribosomal protein L32 [Candidatus Hydrothermia bacterium]|nr:50S ribosomal protein L32 [Candidatus Hydrothermia bacterium]HOL24053.1 50S ribosomal protein L32 [Candidatus Hydrothermia bacterium]HPO79212.1 50S ribosomal protein L32 [Candidatus Hydrothermia bacterium]
MPAPRRKHSRARSRKRRTHYKVKVNEFVKCPNCGEPILPHTVCPHCGYYKGKPVTVVKTKTG